MLTKIFCKTNDSGQQDFYIQAGKKTYFLFEQSYRKTIKSYFGNGVSLEQSLKFANSTSFAIRNVMEKLPLYIKYIEKEYSIAILEQTKRKHCGKKWWLRKRSSINNGYSIKEDVQHG